MQLLEHQRESAVLEEEVRTLEQQERKADEQPPGIDEPVDKTKQQKFTADYVSGRTQFSDTSSVRSETHREHRSETHQENSGTVVFTLTQFLLKKDLLLSRFVPFSDRPETYIAWKASFTSIVRELNVTSFEEMDLLVKWLGPESKRFASSIWASNIDNPTRGLYRIWERLEERYGKPEMVEASLKNKLNSFQPITLKEPKRLYDLLDILTEIECTKENVGYSTLLSYFDSSSGVLPIVSKLPKPYQDKWASQAAKYKKYHGVPFPPFSFYVGFIRELGTMKNDPALQCEVVPEKKEPKRPVGSQSVLSRKTEVENKAVKPPRCPIHRSEHSLNKCRAFRQMPIQERRDFLREHLLCYRCCESKHLSRNCKAVIKCDICGSPRHPTAMHQPFISKPEQSDGGETVPTYEAVPKSEIENKCTELCGRGISGRSCAKIVLARVYPSGNRNNAMQVYAVIDDQSSHTLARSEFFDYFDIQTDTHTYTMKSCGGEKTCSGRAVHGFVIETIDGTSQLNLPSIYECDDIPNNRLEIATPEAAASFPHLQDISGHLPPLDPQTSIVFLIGRDLPAAHHVLEQKLGEDHDPFAQRLRLGWVLVGEVCHGRTHRPDVVVTNKIALSSDGRPTVSEPCTSHIELREIIPVSSSIDYHRKSIGYDIFQTTDADDSPGLSVDDREFLDVMNKEFRRDDSGQWVAPLPFRLPRRRLPDNRQQALKRGLSLDSNLKRNTLQREHAVTFMQRILDAGHAELAPPLREGEELW